MKSQILLLFTVLFFATSILAQPARYLVFNPEDLCNFKEGKTIFVGRVISIEMVSRDALPENLKHAAGHLIKHTVSVEKVFSGQIKLKEVKEIFLVKELEPGLVVNDESIFIFDESRKNVSKFLGRGKWSVPLNRNNIVLSSQTNEWKDVILSRIEARISRFPKSPPLSGIVLQTDASSEKRSLEVYITFGSNASSYKPVPRLTVIAESKKDRKVYKTKTNEKGMFTFDDLEDGDYDLSMVIPKGFEEQLIYNGIKNNNIVSVKKDNCGNYGAVLMIRKIKKP